MTIESSKLWTLRLKNGKRTVVTYADPAQSLTSLKSSLLSSLQSAPASDSITLPSSIDDIEIAKPKDLFDLSKGFELLDDSSDNGADSDDNKGKGKKQEVSLRSLGVKENFVLAYRFRKPDDADDDETLGSDQAWDVEIPSFEDIYGVENQGDLGAVPEYRG